MLCAQRAVHFLVIAGIAVLTALCLYSSRWWLGEFLNHRVLDTYFEVRGAKSPEDVAKNLPNTKDIILVETNHPIPRALLAKVLRQLRYAKVIGLDLVFVDQEAELNEDEKGLYNRYIRMWTQETQALAAALRDVSTTTKVVLGTWPEQKRVSDEQVNWRSPAEPIWQHPPKSLWQGTPYQAHLTIEPSRYDRVVRQVRLFKDTSDNTKQKIPNQLSKNTPSFGLAIAAAALGLSSQQLEKSIVGGNFLKLGPKRIPVDERDPFLIDYVGGRECFEHGENRIMYELVLDLDPQAFKDKIIIIGEVSLKAKEITVTPFGEMPSMQVHANVVATLLGAGPPTALPRWQTALIAFVCSMLLVPPLLRWPLWASFVVTCVQIFLLVVLGAWIFSSNNKILPISVPFIAVMLTYTAIALYEYRRAWNTLGRFIGPAMLQQMVRGVFTPLRLGGREEEASAFFCDLRGFTGLTEQMPLRELNELVNEYTSALVKVVKQYQGRPIDCQGDGVFVLFERPLAGKDYAKKAVQAALEFERVFKQLCAESDRDGMAQLEIGIGITTGTMMIGLMGAEEYLKLGAQGDCVNVAARVQGLSQQLGCTVLINRDTYEQVRGDVAATYTCYGEHALKGRIEPVEIYGVSAPCESKCKDEGNHSAPNEHNTVQYETSARKLGITTPNV